MERGPILYACGQCDKTHEGLPALGFWRPLAFFGLPEAEREQRIEHNDDYCSIDGDSFFVRAVLVIPIHGRSETLEYGPWGSLSKANFDRYVSSFDDDDQGKLGSMFSWFASRLPGYPETMSLKARIIPQNFGKRPLIEIDPEADHPLARDQRDGISLERAIELTMPFLHPH